MTRTARKNSIVKVQAFARVLDDMGQARNLYSPPRMSRQAWAQKLTDEGYDVVEFGEMRAEETGWVWYTDAECCAIER